MWSTSAPSPARCVALRLAARPETRSHTYGLKRAEILAAAFNGISLIVVAALVTFEAIVRLLQSVAGRRRRPDRRCLRRGGRQPAGNVGDVEGQPPSLNVEGAYRHILTDLYGFIGT